MRKTVGAKKTNTTSEFASAFPGLSQHQIAQLWWQAVEKKNYFAMKKMEQSGFDINATNSDGYTALKLAAKAGELETVQVLLAMPKININDYREYRGTSLSHAAEHGHIQIVKLLLARPGIDVNAGGSLQGAPLVQAVREGHEEIAILLLKHKGINRNIKSSYYRSAFHIAASHGLIGVVKEFLASRTFNVNLISRGRSGAEDSGDEGETALHGAAAEGQVEVVNFLLSVKGIDVNKQTGTGVTPLIAALADIHTKDKTKRIGVVKALLAAPDIDVNVRKVYWDKRYGNTALLEAADTHIINGDDRGTNEIVRELLKVPTININLGNDSGETPLMAAVVWGHEGVVDQLLAMPGIDVNARSEFGNTALRSADVHRHPAIVKKLLAVPGIDARDYRKAIRSEAREAAAFRHAQAVLQM